MKTAYSAGDCPTAMARAKEIMEKNFVQIDAHFVTSSCQKKAGNQEAALGERAIASGLMKSVLTSGDGKTPKSAFVVIAIDEEYEVLGILGLVPGDQSLISLDGSSFDRLEGKTRSTGEAVPLFFNIDRIMKH